jgi:cell wall integrity and stress response component
VTADGVVKTVTVTPTPGSNSPSTAEMSSNQGPNTGQIVGIVVGVIGALIVLVAIGFFAYMYRRKRQQNEAGLPSPRGSSSGMGGTLRNTEMSESGWDAASGAALSKRSSRLMPHDPRMDPYPAGLYARSKSHESVNTMHDEHDYSRRVHQPKVLRATNPDPDVEN